MAFTSFEYYLFLPIVFLLYWLVFNRDKQWQNSCLLVASLLFYGWWDWRFLGLLLVTAFSSFYGGLYMNRCDRDRSPPLYLLSGLCRHNSGILSMLEPFVTHNLTDNSLGGVSTITQQRVFLPYIPRFKDCRG